MDSLSTIEAMKEKEENKTIDYGFSPYVDKKRFFTKKQIKSGSSLPFIHSLDGLPVTMDKRHSFGPE